MFDTNDYEEEILDKLVSFFEEKGEAVSERTLLELAEHIDQALNDDND